MNNKLKWVKVGVGCYVTKGRSEYKAIHVDNEHDDTDEWRLLKRNDDVAGGYEWCQTFRLLRDCKAAAEAINND